MIWQQHKNTHDNDACIWSPETWAIFGIGSVPRCNYITWYIHAQKNTNEIPPSACYCSKATSFLTRVRNWIRPDSLPTVNGLGRVLKAWRGVIIYLQSWLCAHCEEQIFKSTSCSEQACSFHVQKGIIQGLKSSRKEKSVRTQYLGQLNWVFWLY